METSPALIAQLDFRPVSPAERQTPGRVKSIPARFYVDKWQEHGEAAEFLESQQALHGEGSKTLVRALIYYRDTVIRPLESSQKVGRRATVKAIAPERMLSQLAFRPVPPERRHRPGRVRHASARLYIDRWVEHRDAYEFIQAQQELHGEGLKTIVRALLHYRDAVINYQRNREWPERAELSIQLSLDLDGNA